jgi:hypothetical protein
MSLNRCHETGAIRSVSNQTSGPVHGPRRLDGSGGAVEWTRPSFWRRLKSPVFRSRSQTALELV